MLDQTEKKLKDYFNFEPLRGKDGRYHDMDRVTKITRSQCDCLAELHAALKPDLSIETGLAYGFSSLAILDAMARQNYGHHIAIDPGQMNYWHGVALTSIEELGLSDRFTWIEARSDSALPKMIEEKKRVQFFFFDGAHMFDTMLTDYCLADQLLDPGGLLIINDMWLPGIRALASFLTKNMTHYEVVPKVHENIFVMRKTGEDRRHWDAFIPFDASGRGEKRPRGFLRKLRGGWSRGL